MRIIVVGIGYVGLSIACLLAQHNEVYAVDINQDKVELINQRKVFFSDNEIEMFFETVDLNLKAVNGISEVPNSVDYLIIATPTDYDEKQGTFDTSSVNSVIDEASKLQIQATIVIRSTVPVGYTEAISTDYPDLDVVFSPEFLREGHALFDNLFPHRIIVGIPKGSHNLIEKATTFASLLAEGASINTKKQAAIPQLIMNSTEAEAVKLFANTYLALRVAFYNELDTFAEARGLDASHIIKGVSLDPRIGDFYNNPSFGYGGYCLPKDTKQLLANYHGIPQEIIRAVVEANQTRMDYITEQIMVRQPKRVGIYRLIMKNNSDNFRQSSIQGIMSRLLKHSIPFVVYEPLLDSNENYEFEVCNNLDEFKESCDLIIANRLSEEINDVLYKIYSRDLWQRD